MIFIKFGGFRPLFIQIFLLSLFESPIRHMLIHSLLSHKFQSERGGKFLHFVTDCLRPQGLYSPWNSPGQNTGVGSHSLLQGIFPTQGSNSGLPRCRRILYQLSHKGSPSILDRILSLLQRIFPTQELNWGLLHCRWTLYQLGY